MKKIALLGLIGLLAFSCVTTGNSSSGRQSRQTGPSLTEEEMEQLASYKALESGFLVDELNTLEGEVYVADPYTQAYEGYRVIRLLGLIEKLTIEEQQQFIQALFSNIPTESGAGDKVRNIVVANYYENGDPLIVHITKAFSGPNKTPAVVAVFNTAGSIRMFGYKLIKSLGPAVDYPRFIKNSDGMKLVGKEYYSIKFLSSGQVSASSATDKELASFESLEDASERVNLTDNYLRDGNKENDDQVVPVLESVIADESVEPIVRVHANLQLYMYYLFRGDLAKAKEITTSLIDSELMDDSVVSGSELAEAVSNDMPTILKIVENLKSKAE
jgi:hypothetical protein